MRFSKIFVLGILCVCLSSQLDAQQKNFTMEDAVLGLTTHLAPKKILHPSWRPGTHHFFQVLADNQQEYLVRTAYPERKADTLLSLRQLNKQLFTDNPLSSFPSITWLDQDYAYFRKGNNLYLGVLTAAGFSWSHWVELPAKAQNLQVNKHRQLAYTVNQNLFMVTRDGKTLAVTEENDPNVISGQSVHRNEFGIDKGIFFSPKGNLLAYYHMDQRMVKDYPIIHWDKVPAKVDMIKYPMAGDTSHVVTVRIFHPTSGRTTILQTGKPADQYLTSVTWSPDEQYIFVALLNRAQNHLQLNKYDVVTGKKVATLFEEKDTKYVEPQHPLTFLPGSKEEFIWWSERDGYMHLYLYHTDGHLIRRLTRGDYEVNDLIGMNPSTQEIIIASAKETPLEQHIYTVNWKTGKMKRLDDAPGIHRAMASDDGKWIYDEYKSANVPNVCLIQSTTSNFREEILRANDPLQDYRRAKVEDVTLYADDGTPLYGKLILPPDLQSNKKYPVIVYLYNGPHLQLVKNTFPASTNLWYEYMAQKGFIVFTMDGRGSANRGQKFEQAIFRNLGTIEMEDQLKGVAYLKSLSYVDAKRIGVYGWSYGGFMTTSFMLRHPDVFKVGVAGGPVLDWSMYEAMYTERYMDTPQENPKGFETSALMDKVKNLKGKLLLIHGTADDVVVWQHSIMFLQQCVKQGVQVDYFVYPEHLHNVRGKDRVHLMQKITDYFEQYL
jgi:dipeptidyl-peptidase-4